MLIKDQVNYKNGFNLICKAVFLIFIFLTLPNLFKFLDNNFQKYFGLSRYVSVFDFIFFNFLFFCYLKKDKIKDFPLILFLGYMVLARMSLFLSIGPIHYRAYYDLFRFFLVLVLFCFFFTSYFQKHHKNIIKVFLVVFFTIALFESIVGIMQFILQKPLGFSLIKEPSFGIGEGKSAGIFISDDKQFFFNKILNNKDGYFLRAHGTFIHPNVFSGFLNISGILTLFLIYKSKIKSVFVIFLVAQLIALILTFSRAGFASFVCCCCLFFTLMLIGKYKIKKEFLICSFCFLLIGGVFSKYLIERGFFNNSFQSEKAKELCLASNNSRAPLKKAAVNMIKKHPFFGVGFRNFLIKKDEYAKDKLERAYVHNIYLLIASETGLLALLVFLVFISVIFINVLRYCLDPFNIALMCAALSFLIIGFFDHYPMSSCLGKASLFTLFGLLNFSIKINKRFSCFEKAFLCR